MVGWPESTGGRKAPYPAYARPLSTSKSLLCALQILGAAGSLRLHFLLYSREILRRKFPSSQVPRSFALEIGSRSKSYNEDSQIASHSLLELTARVCSALLLRNV